MLKSMIKKGNEGNYDIKVMYDIGCVLAKHLRVNMYLEFTLRISRAKTKFKFCKPPA